MKHAAPKKAPNNSRRLKVGSAVTATALTATTLLSFSPAHAITSSSVYQNYTASNGVSSQYHVYADNIDWSQPVGVVFFFDGDHTNKTQTTVHNTQGSALKNMAAVANSHNMVLIPVVSPDQDASGGGLTWWEDQASNGAWFRDFAQHIISEQGLDSSKVWTIGQSGGSEFIGYELSANSQETWRSGGGDIMVGGGNSAGMQTTPSSAYTSIPMYWYVGDNDNVTDSNSYGWSAYRAAISGKAAYDAAGFTNTNLVMVANTNHFQYNHANILESALNKNTVGTTWGGATQTSITTQSNSTTLINTEEGYAAIASSYTNNGGEETLGQATSYATPSIENGLIQNFANHHTIYWTETSGAHTVKFSGAIGARFAENNFEYGFGYPLIDETEYAGGAKQYFGSGSSATGLYWSEATGAHALNLNGAIFGKWATNGHAETLGFPSSDETALEGGAKATFTKESHQTTIYWSEATGAHALNEKGAINHALKNLGGTELLGFPVTDEITENGITSVTFSNGTTISWTAETGIWVS